MIHCGYCRQFLKVSTAPLSLLVSGTVVPCNETAKVPLKNAAVLSYHYKYTDFIFSSGSAVSIGGVDAPRPHSHNNAEDTFATQRVGQIRYVAGQQHIGS